MIGSKKVGDDDDEIVTGKDLWKGKSSLNIEKNSLTIRTGKNRTGYLGI